MDTTITRSSLERARLAAGLTLADVAAAVTRDVQSVRRWESGRTQPPQAVLLRLARLYAVPVAELVD
jgi:transcriptional regulator with XRE-family HTH domain